jgi:mannitol/fructose-specific phosphotransferase system IIA component (Ntr-type)
MKRNVIQGLLINKDSYTMRPNIIAFLSHLLSEDKVRSNIREAQTFNDV